LTWPGFNDAIRFENVWFSYNDNDDYVLRDVSFEIKRGQSMALAGVTGGGKTTVISLILRMYDPQRGRITIDGVDIRNLRLADLRKRFALVLQDIFSPRQHVWNAGSGVAAARTVAAPRPPGLRHEVSGEGPQGSAAFRPRGLFEGIRS
jgi:ABC-type transport system involved in Fe-S cluster assembly fused permease/ATPase subunit